MENMPGGRSRRLKYQSCIEITVGLSVLLGGALLPAFSADKLSPADLVNPMIGTAGGGQTYPAVGYPFAMTQWTPETSVGEEKCIAPYYAKDERIFGFRGSHFLSGSCVQEYGSFSVLPGSGSFPANTNSPSSRINRAEERSRPYVYSVDLTDLHVKADITGTLRSGIFKFTFSQPGDDWLIVRSNARNGKGNVAFDPLHNMLIGSSPISRIYAGDGRSAGYSGYFVVACDHPFEVVKNDFSAPGQIRILFHNVVSGVPVIAKIGTSFVSEDEARRNLASEIPDWNFDAAVRRCKKVWDEALGAIKIQGTSSDSVVFYTALYHCMLAPRTYSDVSGTYPEFAGNKRTQHADGFTYYSDFSIWDTFRALHPLLTIIDTDHDRDMVRSLIEMGKQGGYLPIYPAWNSYTNEMIGDHATAIIGDAYLKGIGGFDADEAYLLMRKNALEMPGSNLYKDGRGRRALDSYMRYGYIPLEDHVLDAYHKNEQVSRTLEYAYDDFVLSEVAQKLGRIADAQVFRKRAENYKFVIDPRVGFARGRYKDGRWDSPFKPSKETSYVTEGTPYQFTFFVLQDIPGLIQWVGGGKKFVNKLDELFVKGYYDQGNEPSHHIAYLYNYTGSAWKTQSKVPEILAEYRNRIDGLPGNDDAGQMSAWYVLSALGLYEVTPGSSRFELTAPHFKCAVLQLAGGKKLRIAETGNGGRFIRSVTLNGEALHRSFLLYSEIMNGGDLVFDLSEKPNKSWPKASVPE